MTLGSSRDPNWETGGSQQAMQVLFCFLCQQNPKLYWWSTVRCDQILAIFDFLCLMKVKKIWEELEFSSLFYCGDTTLQAGWFKQHVDFWLTVVSLSKPNKIWKDLFDSHLEIFPNGIGNSGGFTGLTHTRDGSRIAWNAPRTRSADAADRKTEIACVKEASGSCDFTQIMTTWI